MELAYDDGEFKVPGRDERPKRIRFPAVVEQAAPEPKPVLSPEPKVEEAVLDEPDGSTEEERSEKDVTEKKTPDIEDDLF